MSKKRRRSRRCLAPPLGGFFASSAKNARERKQSMKTFTIQAPAQDGRTGAERALDYKFIKEGFSIWAVVLGPFWSIINGLWLEALVHYVGLGIALNLLSLIGFHEVALVLMAFVSNIFFAIFAYDIQRYHYSRNGYKMLSVINGKNRDDCEARFFRGSLASQ